MTDKTTLKRCAVCQNFAHCTAAGYCNCGAYSVRQETTERVTYSDSLSMLAVEDNGKRLEPQYALVKYEDGWRMFARYKGLGDAVRVTSYTIDPMEVLKDA